MDSQSIKLCRTFNSLITIKSRQSRTDTSKRLNRRTGNSPRSSKSRQSRTDNSQNTKKSRPVRTDNSPGS